MAPLRALYIDPPPVIQNLGGADAQTILRLSIYAALVGAQASILLAGQERQRREDTLTESMQSSPIQSALAAALTQPV